MSVVKKTAIAAAFGLAATVVGTLAALPALALDPGYRAPDPNTTLIIETTKGEIIAELSPIMAPNHVAQVVALAHQHFYDGQIFHRVIEDFMDQTGDPTGTGQGGSKLPNIKAEFTMRHDQTFPMAVASHPAGALMGFVGALPVESQVNELMPLSKDGKVTAWGLYCQGTVGMARDNDNDSANSQFFLMRAPNSVLEKRYTAFGVVLSGLDVVRKIKIGEPPVNPDKMLTVRVLADIPPAERPQIEVMDTMSPQFRTIIDQTRKAKGADFSVCDVQVPVKVTKVTGAPVASAAK
jgi:peptidylprolyl isomerase